ncbi:MAG TPA: PIG-L family deacetylase [Pyrinomonadaceae bacterium]|nr:PIG-L family deacetylase [Pyrinomonadaceae bacterium]
MRRLFTRLVALACVVAISTQGSFVAPASHVARAQVHSTYREGAVALGLLLRRLQTTASVLHTGAHPDDEDSALIARLARGDGARVAYLSLNRGEGGQNRIGAELFDALGIIRTEELLQARRLDGGEQFFTRAFDFGFTKTREETARRWNEREILADMVRVIRRFRPAVVVSRWQGTQADGHGQHQFAGYLTPIALSAAADPAEFPEQLAEGLRPWRVKKFYVSHFGQDATAATAATTTGATGQGRATGVVEIDTGRFDPLLGRSFYELAMEGRSQHKSQGEAALELRGAQTSRVRLVSRAESAMQTAAVEGSIYDGLDTTIRGIARTANLTDNALANDLKRIEETASAALQKFNVLDPRTVVTALTAGLDNTLEARSKLATLKDSPDARAEADFLLAQKEREFREALQLAHGVRVDALASMETVAREDSFIVAVRAFVPEQRARVAELRLRAPEGWRVERLLEPSKAETAFVARETPQSVAYFRVHVPADAEPTAPYWLARREADPPRRKGDMYVWRKDDPQTEPFAPPLIVGEAVIDVGASQVVSAPVEYRYLDAVRGEVRRELNVVPEMTVRIDPSLIIVPLHTRARARQVTLQLINNIEIPKGGAEHAIPTAGTRLRLPQGWPTPRGSVFKFESKGERVTAPITLTIPNDARAGAYSVGSSAHAMLSRLGRPELHRLSEVYNFGRTQHEISYPHIQTHYYYTDAEATVRLFDLRVAPVRVGYIMGSGDEVPEAIRRMGLDVTMLDESQLATGDLSRFDTIVVGVRASQTRPDFVAHHARLIEFVRRGGALIVQYQRPDYAAKKLPPLPAAMEVPPQRAGGSPTIARVVDERAPVRVLAPAHPAFNFPNRITAADWDDWVQERNLYNFTTFDSGYTPLLESHDAGDAEGRGGQVYARLGRGHYVYTSYAWFRQLPAGVPGAYRLFANLLSLPKAPTPKTTPRRTRVQP